VVRLRKKKEEDAENLERWLLTYADLITLLLAFFVVMYSMSQIDAKRFGEMSESLHGILKGGDNVLNPDEVVQTEDGHGVLKLGNLRMLQKAIEGKSEERKKLQDVQTEITERGLVIHIVERALFQEGSSTLQGNSWEVLDLIYNEIDTIPNHIRVEGHTDDRPIMTEKFPSNWELSSSRATEVVRYFVNEYSFPPNRISALGYGEFRPIQPNNSIENRARNRRVDIVILTMELSLQEPSSQMLTQTEIE
jgi:chemotaxis protein MotB